MVVYLLIYLIGVMVISSDNIINLSIGTYGVSILDSNSCLLVDTFSINQPNLLISQLTSRPRRRRYRWNDNV